MKGGWIVSDLGNKEVMAKNIKYYLKENDITQTEMCNTLGFKMSTVSDWMHARTYPRIDKIEMMANYFGIEKSDLVEQKSSKTIELNKKDERDIAKRLEQTLDQLESDQDGFCLLYTSPSPRDQRGSRMPSSA